MRDLLRDPDCTDEAILHALEQGMHLKPERHNFLETPEKLSDSCLKRAANVFAPLV